MRDQTGKCRECQTEIVWTKTEKGKTMPCDLAPNSDGNGFYLFRRRGDMENAGYIEAVSVKSSNPSAVRAKERGDQSYESHFKTCTNPKRFSGRNR